MGGEGTVNHCSISLRRQVLKVKKSPGESSAAAGSISISFCVEVLGGGGKAAAAAAALNSYVHRRESQAVGRRGKGVISPGAEFYHHHHTDGLCTFSPLPCTWPTRHLYLLIPVGGGAHKGCKGIPRRPGTGVRTVLRQLTPPHTPHITLKVLGLR